MIRKVMGVGLVLALAVSAVALGAKAKTISTGNISKGITGGHAISQSLNVKKSGKIKDLNVGVAFSTNENDDFTFSVMSPKGKMVQLSSENGGSGSGYGSSCTDLTTFDDEAAQDIQDYEGVDHVFDGVSYKPEQYDDNSDSGGLVALDGSQLKGKWRLIVTDADEIGAGSLKCFKLTAKTK